MERFGWVLVEVKEESVKISGRMRERDGRWRKFGKPGNKGRCVISCFDGVSWLWYRNVVQLKWQVASERAREGA